MKSMTGFGLVRLDTPELKASIQMKSWNNRYLEMNVQIPGYLSSLERPIRDAVETRVCRGKVELTVRILGGDLPTDVSIDETSAKAVADALRRLSKASGIDESVRLSHILGIDGIISYERKADAEAVWARLLPALESCLDAFDAERLREGQDTKADLENKLDSLENALVIIDTAAPDLESTVRSNLRKKFEDVMGSLVDESRILAEIASYLAKHTINEEIVRLRSHIASFRSSMEESVCGKKLDFICQEMNRETNTIGSKSFSTDISSAVIAMKDAIENIREQIRNIE